MINEDEIKPSDIAAHLAMLPDMDVKSAWQLLDPADKQNVPKLLHCCRASFSEGSAPS